MVLIDYVTCIRDIPKSPDKFFYKRKGHGKCGNFDFFRKSFFFTKLLDIGEVFDDMKNNHQVKIGS